MLKRYAPKHVIGSLGTPVPLQSAPARPLLLAPEGTIKTERSETSAALDFAPVAADLRDLGYAQPSAAGGRIVPQSTLESAEPGPRHHPYTRPPIKKSFLVNHSSQERRKIYNQMKNQIPARRFIELVPMCWLCGHGSSFEDEIETSMMDGFYEHLRRSMPFCSLDELFISLAAYHRKYIYAEMVKQNKVCGELPAEIIREHFLYHIDSQHFWIKDMIHHDKRIITHITEQMTFKIDPDDPNEIPMTDRAAVRDRELLRAGILKMWQIDPNKLPGASALYHSTPNIMAPRRMVVDMPQYHNAPLHQN